MCMALALWTGCHRKVIKLTEAGRFEEAVDHAESKKWRPRGPAARAYARALVALGRSEQARDVLLHDYRHGSQLVSLLALADLERDLGRRGVAAFHYARVFELDAALLRSRQDACALFRERARVLLGHGEALAAEQEMRRVALSCDAVDDAALFEDARLHEAIDRAAIEQVNARVGQTLCPEEGCREVSATEREAALERSLAEAETEGPGPLLRRAVARGARLDPKTVVGLVVADARGRLGRFLPTDDAFRIVVGERTWTDYAPVVMSRDPAVSAWAQVRLSTVVEDLPVPPAPKRGPNQLDRWVDRAAELAGAQRWRVFAHRGDLPAVELELSAVYRPKPRSPRPEDTGAEPDAAPVPSEDLPENGPDAYGATPALEVPSHWAARVAIDDVSLPAMLVVAALRAEAGQEDLSLELRRFLLGRAHADRQPGIARITVDEVARDIVYGRPWHALAVVDALPPAAVPQARAAASTAVALTRAFCGGACRGDEDEAVVRRVMGDPWVGARLAELDRVSRSVRPPAAFDGGCPAPGELVAADATGVVAEALRAWQADPNAPGRGQDLVAAVESQSTLTCSRSSLLPLLANGGHSVSAGRLAEFLAHAPQMSASSELDAHARLAMVAGEKFRAELLSVAAGGASQDPRATWLGLARFARRAGLRELELMGLRETLLHSPGLDHPGARRALVLRALWDVQRGWAESQREAGRDAIVGHVAEYLDWYPGAQRHHVLRDLASRVASAPWLETTARAAVKAALFAEGEVHPQMAREVANVSGQRLEQPRGPLDVAGHADAARTGSPQRRPPGASDLRAPGGDPRVAPRARGGGS